MFISTPHLAPPSNVSRTAWGCGHPWLRTTALESMNYLHKIDNFDVLEKIVKRLPHSWLGGWQAELDTIIHTRGEEASIKHLASYVSLKTRQATNFKCNWSHTERSTGKFTNTAKPHKGREESSFSTSTNTTFSISKCKLCHAPHYLNQCKDFRKLTVPERLKFVKENKLCYSCLETGHSAERCNREHPCRKQGCDKQHTTLLHPAQAEPDVKMVEEVKVRNGYADVPQTWTTRKISAFPN